MKCEQGVVDLNQILDLKETKLFKSFFFKYLQNHFRCKILKIQIFEIQLLRWIIIEWMKPCNHAIRVLYTLFFPHSLYKY